MKKRNIEKIAKKILKQEKEDKKWISSNDKEWIEEDWDWDSPNTLIINESNQEFRLGLLTIPLGIFDLDISPTEKFCLITIIALVQNEDYGENGRFSLVYGNGFNYINFTKRVASIWQKNVRHVRRYFKKLEDRGLIKRENIRHKKKGYIIGQVLNLQKLEEYLIKSTNALKVVDSKKKRQTHWNQLTAKNRKVVKDNILSKDNIIYNTNSFFSKEKRRKRFRFGLPVEQMKQIKQWLDDYDKQILNRDEYIILDHWNKLGPELRKHSRPDTKVYKNSIKLVKKHLKKYSVEQIKKAIDRYYELYTSEFIDREYFVKTLAEFFKFNDFTKRKILNNNYVTFQDSSWFKACILNDLEKLRVIHGLVKKDRFPSVSRRFRKLWEDRNHGKKINWEPRELNQCIIASTKLVKFIEQNKRKLRVDQREIEFPGQFVKYLFEMYRDKKIHLGYFMQDFLYENQLPKFLKWKGLMK